MGKVIRLKDRASTKLAQIRPPLKGPKVVELQRRETETEDEEYARLLDELWEYLASGEMH